jgi:hypothetical protein
VNHLKFSKMNFDDLIQQTKSDLISLLEKKIMIHILLLTSNKAIFPIPKVLFTLRFAMFSNKRIRASHLSLIRVKYQSLEFKEMWVISNLLSTFSLFISRLDLENYSHNKYILVIGNCLTTNV